jgi:hypothetical protein
VQTVPRAELFAIATVIQHVTHGDIHIISDSKINVDLYKKPRAQSLASSNADLWIEIFEHIDRKQLTVTMFWMQAHLDKKHAKHDFPPLFFALNHLADGFAEMAASAAELPKHMTSTIQYHAAITKHVQRRFVRILMSLCHSSQARNKKVTIMKASAPTIEEAASMSQHTLKPTHAGWMCLYCNGYCSRASSAARQWLESSCNPLPFDDTNDVVRIPSWHPIQKCNSTVHHTHHMCSFKNVVFCEVCGFYSSIRLVKLAAECTGHTTISSARARDRLRAGLLPQGLKHWPLPDSLTRIPFDDPIGQGAAATPLDSLEAEVVADQFINVEELSPSIDGSVPMSPSIDGSD